MTEKMHSDQTEPAAEIHETKAQVKEHTAETRTMQAIEAITSALMALRAIQADLTPVPGSVVTGETLSVLAHCVNHLEMQEKHLLETERHGA